MEVTEQPVGAHRGYAAYLALQALAGLLWWCSLALLATVRSWFELDGHRHERLDAFFVADLVVFVVGSAVGAWAVSQAKAWAPLVIAFTAGGTAYATLYLADWAVITGVGGLGLVIMVGATAATTSIAVRTWQATR